MMTTLLRCLLAAALVLPLLTHARSANEDARIEFLLKSIADLQGAKFIRAGKEYEGNAAEEHLRMKLGKAGDRVQTAEQFIDGVASKSFFSGKPYQIRFADGRIMNAGEFLHSQLRTFK